MKKVIVSLLCLTLCIAPVPVCPARATGDAAEIVLYTVDSWAAPYLILPPGCSSYHRITVPDGAASSFCIISGESVDVSQTGLISPRFETVYWYGSVGYTVLQRGRQYDRITSHALYGTSVVGYLCNGKSSRLTVEVKDYSEVYADEVMDAYIAENIPAGMPFYSKLEKVCRFPTQYDYSADASRAASMIVKGKGDCWASTDAIVRICGKLGIEARPRNGNRDFNAGGGHRNALITAGRGDYYVLEAGFDEKAPRTWKIYHRSSLFSCRDYGEEGLEVYQYDGDMSDMSTMAVPGNIGGKDVLSIGKSFLYRNTSIEEVVLPPTVENIDDSAFYFCTSLTDLHLPSSVKTVGRQAFASCRSLVNLSCDENNPYLTVEDGVLYDKQKTKVIAAPACQEAFLPDTVESVGTCAFYYNDKLTGVSLGKATETVEDCAFFNCSALCEADLGSVRTIGKSAFENCVNLTHISIPSETTEIGNLAFCFAGLTSLSLPAGISLIGKNAFYGCPLTDIYYEGSAEQWEALRKSDSGIPKEVVVHFDYTPMKGDVNGDGEVDNLDASAVLKYDVGLATAAVYIQTQGDVNDDCEVDNIDAALILKYDAGMLPDF